VAVVFASALAASLGQVLQQMRLLQGIKLDLVLSATNNNNKTSTATPQRLEFRPA
jgi:hypothetical protein